MQQLEDVVRQAKDRVDSSIRMMVVGSYRRGAATSGDIDVMLTCEGGVDILKRMLDDLRSQGFITDTISSGPTKFMGEWWLACMI